MKKKILIPIIVAAIIIVGGGVTVYSMSRTVKSEVNSTLGIGHSVNYNKVTPNSKYNNFRNNLYSNLFRTLKNKAPMGVGFTGTASEGFVQFLTDNQIQNLTGTDNEKDMIASVTIVKPGTPIGPNEQMVTNQYGSNPPICAMIRFWDVNMHATDLGNLDFKLPAKLKEEGAITDPTTIVWGEYGNQELPNFKAKMYVASYKAITDLGKKIDRASNIKLITTIANFTTKQLEEKTGTTVEKDMTVRPVKNGETIHTNNSYQFVYPDKKSTLIIFGHSK